MRPDERRDQCDEGAKGAARTRTKANEKESLHAILELHRVRS